MKFHYGYMEPLEVPGDICRLHGCSACCHGTEMPLTQDDIDRIAALGYGDFYTLMDGYRVLKNVDGHCIFLVDGRCTIYPFRPEGCRLYPFVYDETSGEVMPDHEYCPHARDFAKHINDDIKRAVSDLARRLERERIKAGEK